MRASLRLVSVLIATVVSGLIAGVLGGAEDATIVSAWKTEDVRIDGRADEWPALTPLPKGPSLAARNDAEDLYLVIASRDVTVRRALGPGLVLWLDPSRDK